MAYKGTTPSELWSRYDCEGGQHLLEMDLLVASEINDRISDATREASNKDGKGAAARLKQRRERRKSQPINNADDMMNIIREAGMPIEEVSNSSSEGEKE